jgi:endonuclease YncB( thermonuclease family)
MTRLLTVLSLICLLVLPARAAKPWQTLAGCRWVDYGANDGDSFRVRWNDQEFTFRIYFADTPEVYARQRDRVSAQAAYFGITEEQAVQVGNMARAFTENLLKDGFTIRTRWQGVYGGDRVVRKYGTVTVNGQDLAEMLVANGLARIHGVGIGGETREEVARLRALEAQAKAEGRGAWGMRRT